MESIVNKTKQQSSLQKKLQLLSSIRSGNIEQIANLTKELSKHAKTNPQLYQKFNNFVSEHKQGLLQMENDDKQDNNQNVQIIIVDDDNVDDKQWHSDDSIDLSEDSDSEDQLKQLKQKGLFKQVQNVKSIMLKQKKNVQQYSKQQTLNPKIDSSKAKKQTVANPAKVNSVGFSKCQNSKPSVTITKKK